MGLVDYCKKFTEFLWNRFLKGGFLLNVLVLVGGTAVSQALLFLISPLITRLYTPSNFGTWSVIQSLSLILSVIASWRYELSIVIPKKEEEAANLLIGCILITLSMTSLLVIVVVGARSQITALLGAEELLPWLWVLPLTLLLTGIYQPSSYWLMRQQNFRFLAIARIGQSVTMITTQVGLALILGSTALGLIVGSMVGQIVAPGILIFNIWRKDRRYLIDSCSWSSIKDGLRKYSNFPLYVAPYSFIGNFQQQLLLLLLTKYTTFTVLGLYALANRIVKMPITLIATAINQVFFPKAAQNIKSSKLEKLVGRAIHLLVIIITPPFSISILNAEFFFRSIFGEEWSGASIYAVWLALPAFMLLYTSWLDRIYDVLGKQRLALSMEIVYDIVSIALFTIALLWRREPVMGVAVYSLTTLIYNFIWLIITFKLANFSLNIIWKEFASLIGIFLIAALIHNILINFYSIIITVALEGIIMIIYYGILGLRYYKVKQKKEVKTNQ